MKNAYIQQHRKFKVLPSGRPSLRQAASASRGALNTRQCIAPLIAAIALAGTSALADVLPPVQDSSSLKGKLTAVTGKATTLPVCATRKAFVSFDLGNLPLDVQPADIAQARL